MRAPPLGLAVHVVVAAVTTAGVVAAAVALTILRHRNVPVPFYSIAIPVAGVAVTAITLRAWRRRRWPFLAEPSPRREWAHLLAALLAGGSIGAYAGMLSDWVYDWSLDMIWFTLLPICVSACAGDGYGRGLARLAALHVGAEVGAQMGYGAVLGVSWTVTRNHLPYLPVSVAGVLALETVLRRLASRLTRPGAPPSQSERVPRRAR